MAARAGRTAAILTAVSLLLGSAACIDDPTDVDDQFALSAEDAALLGLTVWRHALEAQLDADVGGSPGAAASIARAPEVFTTTDTSSVACALDGSIDRILDAVITIDTDTGELEIEADLTLTHDACREGIEGQTFSFFGSPTITASVVEYFDGQGGQTLSGSIDGSVIVITEGAPVLCEVDVIAGPVDVVSGPVTYSVRGSFCGESMDETVTENLGG